MKNNTLKLISQLGLMALASAVCLSAFSDHTCSYANKHTDRYGTCITRESTGHTLKGLETKGWAYYCTPDHPYLIGFENDSSNGVWQMSSSFFVGNRDKLSAEYTNWNLGKKHFGEKWYCTAKRYDPCKYGCDEGL